MIDCKVEVRETQTTKDGTEQNAVSGTKIYLPDNMRI
jgi:hypothetical protein